MHASALYNCKVTFVLPSNLSIYSYGRCYDYIYANHVTSSTSIKQTQMLNRCLKRFHSEKFRCKQNTEIAEFHYS